MSKIDYKKKKRKAKTTVDYDKILKDATAAFKPFQSKKKKKKFKRRKIKNSKAIEQNVKLVITNYFVSKEKLDEVKEDQKSKNAEDDFAYSVKRYEEMKQQEESELMSPIPQTPTVAALEQEMAFFDGFYEYRILLSRIYEILKKRKNADQNLKMPPPLIGREPKKTIFINFQTICDSLHREKEHLFWFILNELETNGSTDNIGRLIIRNIFYPNQIETVLKKYIKNYVRCDNCKRFDTLLTRDSQTRLYNLVCNYCGAGRTVTRTQKRR